MEFPEVMRVKNRFLEYYIGLIFGAAVIGIAWWMSIKSVEEPTCVELQSEIWAFQQCLKFRPSCKISGPPAFARYHKIKNLEQKSCPESADDLQSEIK